MGRKRQNDAQKRDAYQQKKERAARREADLSQAERDISPLPKLAPKDKRLKKEVSASFKRYCEIVHPGIFSLDWSDDHLEVIAKIQEIADTTGQLALAMPRGFGKTSLLEVAAEWAVLTGRSHYVVIVAASATNATKSLGRIKNHFADNPILLRLFPEACYPIVRLENLTQRCAGQTYQGRSTKIAWKGDNIVLPTIEGSLASGAKIETCSLGTGIRGGKHSIEIDGVAQDRRPDFVLVDDPQTDASAKSEIVCNRLEGLLKQGIKGLAGPNQKMRIFMACTVIAKDDLSDRFLDRKRNPSWNGIRKQMVYEWPKNQKLWDQWRDRYFQELANELDHADSDRFYLENREAMDEGSKVAWPAYTFSADIEAISNIHFCYQKIMRDDQEAFDCECQNAPPEPVDESVKLQQKEVSNRTNGLRRGEVPDQATTLTAFIDVQGSLLYYMVCGFESNFTGYVVDYGAWPEQRRSYYTLKEVTNTLQKKLPGQSLEAQLTHGIGRLVETLANREYKGTDGSKHKIDQLLIDAGYKDDVVKTFCRKFGHAQSGSKKWLMPSFGRSYAGRQKGIMDVSPTAVKKGHYWYLTKKGAAHNVNHILYDPDYWKTLVYQRLETAVGSRGALTFFGDAKTSHRMLAEQLTSEEQVTKMTSRQTYTLWELTRRGRDNHFWDCLVGCHIAASVCGVSLKEVASENLRKKKRTRRRHVRRFSS